MTAERMQVSCFSYFNTRGTILMYKNSVFRVLPPPLFILLIPVVHKSQVTRLDTMVSNVDFECRTFFMLPFWDLEFLSGS